MGVVTNLSLIVLFSMHPILEIWMHVIQILVWEYIYTKILPVAHAIFINKGIGSLFHLILSDPCFLLFFFDKKRGYTKYYINIRKKGE